MTKIFNLNNMVLLVAFAISTIAEYYGILGLTAIFAGAFISTIIMGSILGIAKITITMWLRKYWGIASVWIKTYLVAAVIILSTLTCIGVFGHLSKAHLEHAAPIGDVQAKIDLIDTKIAAEKENLTSNKALLSQLDNQVNSALSRTDNEQGVNRSVQIRKQQAKERSEIQKSMEKSNTLIAQYNEEKAPMESQVRKIEADVGPLKFLAAFIYGDNADKSALESAVRWMIVLLVIVFDPLAIAMVLAASESKEYEKNKPKIVEAPAIEPMVPETMMDELDKLNRELDAEANEKPKEEPEPEIKEEPKEESILAKHPYLNQPFKHFEDLTPMVYVPEYRRTVVVEEPLPLSNEAEQIEIILEQDVTPITEVILEQTSIETDGVTEEPYTVLGDGQYVVYQGKKMNRRVVESMVPNFKIAPDSNFGTSFPKLALTGSTFVRVDSTPYRLFKYVNPNWMEVNRGKTDAHLTDAFIEFLIEKVQNGEVDVDSLPENEQSAVEEYLRK